MDAIEYQTIIRLSVTILVGILALVIVLLLARWQIGRRSAKEKIDPEALRLEMEALAEKRKKERENLPPGEREEDSEERGEKENEFIEGQPL